MHHSLVSILSSKIVSCQSFQGGITEEQMLKYMGANTHLKPEDGKILLEVFLILHFHFHNFFLIYELLFFFQNENIGFAYLSQRETSPSLYVSVNVFYIFICAYLYHINRSLHFIFSMKIINYFSSYCSSPYLLYPTVFGYGIFYHH